MALLRRFGYEISGLAAFDWPTILRYFAALFTRFPQVLRARNLTAVDSRMTATASLRRHGIPFTFPLQEIDALTAPFDRTSAFGGLREMYGHDVYVRGFTRAPSAGSVIDLGANRGLFSPIAVKVLGASTVVAVEPERRYGPVAELLLDSNGIPRATVHRVAALIAPRDGPGRIAFRTLLERRGMNGVDFCKMDIEGAEFALVDSGEFLPRVNTLAAEIHCDCGDVEAIAASLHDEGFAFRFTDQFGSTCPPRAASYLYAARDHSLIRSGNS